MNADYVLNAFTAYCETAVWSGNDWSDDSEDNPPTLESEGYCPDDIAEDAAASMMADVEAFIDANEDDILAANLDAGQVGHDFFLTRNQHGAGFWDRGLGVIGTRLTDAAHVYGESELYVGDDGQLYV